MKMKMKMKSEKFQKRKKNFFRESKLPAEIS